MCLVVIALDAHPRYSLVIAANRDEFHARASLPAHWGETPPFAGMLAGRDLVAGGTWLGVRRDGRWALVTNVRKGRGYDGQAPSRGSLVPAILNSDADSPAVLATLARDGQRYNGFNVLAGDRRRATWASNRASGTKLLASGVHGLSNALLDTPWPKLLRTRDAMSAWATRDSGDLSPLFAALSDRTIAADAELPATGVAVEWERLLSAPFIVSEDYGTRCSTVLAITRNGEATFVERSFDARGDAIGEVAFDFELLR
jgi:uncharacterized protein with NRDE domain